MKIIYPTIDELIKQNYLALEIIKLKKADKHQVLSNIKLYEIIKECERTNGDVYDKAKILLKGIIQKHPFASGNRRTAFIVTRNFIIFNNYKFSVESSADNSTIMLGIRENYYTDEEIKEWMKNGKIKDFKRNEKT